MGKADLLKQKKEENGQSVFQQKNTLDLLGKGIEQPFAEQEEKTQTFIPRNSSKVTGTAPKMANICLRLDPYLYNELKTLAAIEQRSVNTMIAVAIKAYITDPDNDKKINQFRRIGQ